jgi:hypothetical protein
MGVEAGRAEDAETLVFINYRSSDAASAAALLHAELSDRVVHCAVPDVRGGDATMRSGAPNSSHGGYLGQPTGTGMPGLMRGARVLLFVMGGMQLTVGVLLASLLAGIIVNDGGGIADAAAIVSVLLGLGALSIILGTKFATGGRGVRVTTIVYASLMIVACLGGLGLGDGFGLIFTGGPVIGLACGGIILALMVTAQAGAWFNRPR